MKSTNKTKLLLPKDSAGHLMTTHVPTIGWKKKIRDIFSLLQKEKFETIDAIYIIDQERRLTNVLSLKKIFSYPPDTALYTIRRKIPLLTVHPWTDQEKTVYLALKNNLISLPVTERDGTFVGAVGSTAMFRTLYKEAREDLLHVAGVHTHHNGTGFDNVLEMPLLQSIRHRLPWLILGLFGGLAAAGIVNQFEQTLEKNIILAAFIPLIVYMADAVGTQMEAFALRDFSWFRQMNYVRYFLRQLTIIFSIGLISSFLLAVTAALLYNNIAIALTLGFSLLLAILSSVFTGLLIPYMFSRFKIDPANASGPIATIIQDVLSIIVYFSIASWLL